jgi:malate dehydrogenase
LILTLTLTKLKNHDSKPNPNPNPSPNPNPKAGAGSATLSMAYAGARMAESILKGLSGNPNPNPSLNPSPNPNPILLGRSVMECGFVQSDIIDGLPFFASQLVLGPNGVEKVTSTGTLNAFEQQKLEELKAELKANIDKGIKFGQE